MQTLLSHSDEAEEALRRGSISGYLEFTPMFSSEVFNKVVNSVNDEESIMEGYDNTSSLVVHLDSSGAPLFSNFVMIPFQQHITEFASTGF